MSPRARIALLAVALLLVIAGLVWLRAETAAAPTLTLRFWNGFTGPDGRTMLRIVRRFNQENPDLRVVMQRMDWATYYNKIFVAGLGGRAPEVFVVHTDVLPRFHRAGLLRPIRDLIGAFDVTDLDPNVWASVQFPARVPRPSSAVSALEEPSTQPAPTLAPFALPLDVHPLGLYYNRKLFREAGIVDERGEPQPPATRDEFLSALRKLKRTQTPPGQPPYQQWGYVFTWQRTNFWALLHQFNGRAFTPDYSACILDHPNTVAALQFCAGLVHEEQLVPSPQNIDAWIGFRQGKVGMAFEGIYMLPDLQKQQDLDFAGAPMPVLGDRPATWASSHNLCLRHDLKGDELAAAWRFIRFLSDHSLDWAEGGQVPVRRSLRNTPRFAAMPVQAQFARQIPYVCYPPRIPFSFEFFTEYDLAIERALRGTATPAAALATATQEINAIMADDRAIHPDAGGAP